MASCCKMDSVYPWQNAVVAFRHATAPWSLAQERMPLWTVTPGQDICFQMNQLESISAFFFQFCSVFFVYLPSPVCVKSAVWCAPNIAVQFTNPGASGALALLPVGVVRGWGHAPARKKKAALPAATRSRRTAACSQPAQVGQTHLHTYKHKINTHYQHPHCGVLQNYIFSLSPASLHLSLSLPPTASGLWAEWVVIVERVQCLVWRWGVGAEQDGGAGAWNWGTRLFWTTRAAHCL